MTKFYVSRDETEYNDWVTTNAVASGGSVTWSAGQLSDAQSDNISTTNNFKITVTVTRGNNGYFFVAIGDYFGTGNSVLYQVSDNNYADIEVDWGETQSFLDYSNSLGNIIKVVFEVEDGVTTATMYDSDTVIITTQFEELFGGSFHNIYLSLDQLSAVVGGSATIVLEEILNYNITATKTFGENMLQTRFALSSN